MNIKYLLGSFLILLVAASAITPAFGASNTQNNSHDVKFVKIKMIDDAQWENMTDEEKAEYLGQFEVSDENGNVRVMMHNSPDGEIYVTAFSFSEDGFGKMRVMQSLNAEENESYFVSRHNQMDIEFEDGERKHMTFFAAGASFASLTEEELEALKDMTEDEREAFLSEYFTQALADAVAEGTLTQEEADEMLAARETGGNVRFSHEGNDKGMTLKITRPASDEEFSALLDMTDDDRQEFFLSQIKASLDADVAAGRLTQEEADEIYAHHESGTMSYGMGTMSHKTVSFKAKDAVAAE